LPSWLVSTKEVGVKVNTTFLNSRAQAPAFNFPRAKSLQPIGSTGVVLLPLVMALLQRYDLTDQTSNSPVPIGGFTFDVDFINVEKGGTSAAVLGQLSNFTKNLPIPPNPYTTGVQLFGYFANQMIDATIKSDMEANSVDIGSFAYDLATSDDECKNNPRALTEGTTGVIFDYPSANIAGVIKTSEVSKYCFKIDRQNIVSFAPKSDENFDCSDIVKTKLLAYSPLNNPQIIFSFSPIAKQSAGLVERKVTLQAGNAPVAVAESTIEGAALKLETCSSGGAQSSKTNLSAWLEGLQKDQLPVTGRGLESTVQSDRVVLTADQARDYDAARAIIRCARVGISPTVCGW
jgi:hypothetical protein